MLYRLLLSATLLTGVSAIPAQADHGWTRHVFFFLDDEEDEVQDAYQDEQARTVIVVPAPDRRHALYGEELDYYEPQFEPKRKMAPPKKAAARPATILKKAVSVQSKPIAARAAAVQRAEIKQASSVTCEKGASVVGEYGFATVKPKSCAGKVFVYSANRSGKLYDVSVSSLNGEITEVRKVQ